jgi:hypothetical protein
MLTLPDTWPALAATKLAPANFTADHPRVWPLMANIDGLYAIFKTSLEAQYDAYETEAKPKLKDVVLVRGSLLPAMCGRAFVAHPDIALCVRVSACVCVCVCVCAPRGIDACACRVTGHLCTPLPRLATLVWQLTQFNGLCLAGVILLIILPISIKVRVVWDVHIQPLPHVYPSILRFIHCT